MVMSDPISDMLTRIRNGFKAQKKEVVVLCSKVNKSILDILIAEGYLKGYTVREVRKGISEIVVEMKYAGEEPAITEMKRLSTPGLRRYSQSDKIPSFYNGLGVTIVSTSEGMMTDRDARQKNIGGELICQVF